jgi:hypothetical protein
VGRSSWLLLTCALAAACHSSGPAAEADEVPATCTPQPFTEQSLSLRSLQGDDCDADPSSCASPCQAQPLTEEWRYLAIEPYAEQLQQIDFGSSLVDPAGDIYFATCEGASAAPGASRNCAFSSIASNGTYRSLLDLTSSFGDRHLTLHGAVLSGNYAIAVMTSPANGGSITLVGVRTDDPQQQMWAFTQLGATLVGVHEDPANGRVMLVYNERDSTVMLGLDPTRGMQMSRMRYSMAAAASVMDSQGNLTLALQSPDWHMSPSTGFLRLLSLDPVGCPRWKLDSTWHGPSSQALRAVSGGLLLTFGDQVLHAADGSTAYALPAVPASVVLDATQGFAVTGMVAPELFDELAATDPVGLFAFDRESGDVRFRIDYPVGALKLQPLLTSRGTLLFATTEGAAPAVRTVLREVTRTGHEAWACDLPHDAQGGYLAGGSISGGLLLTADVVTGRGASGTQPNGIAIRAFKLGSALAPAPRGWVMEGGNPGRGGIPQP